MKRKTFVLENGIWKEVDMISIKKGNIFRIIEVGETEYMNIDGITDFTAVNDASINDDGIVAVMIDMRNI
jgi:saccharopine dehydrogenase-like NADP-dependent oxidoreductase